MLLFLGVDKKEVLAKGRGCTFIDKDSSHTKRLIIARHCAKYFTRSSHLLLQLHVVGNIISSILQKLSNLTKVTLLITKPLSQDFNLSWLIAEPTNSITFNIPQHSHEVRYYYYPCLSFRMELKVKAQSHTKPTGRARIQYKSKFKPCNCSLTLSLSLLCLSLFFSLI